MSSTVAAHRMASAQLGNERTVWVRAPRDPEALAQATFFLDAELYRERVGVETLLDELDASDAIANSWFVFVSMQSPDARWIECPCHPPFARFVNEELLLFLEARYPTIALCHERVLAGLSYTGLAAAFAAIQPSAPFARVISQSGSFWWNDCWLAQHVRDLAVTPNVAFWLDVGARETAENVRHKEDVLQVVSQLDSNRRMRDALRERGCEVQYLEFDGGHDFAAWRRTLPAALRWALPA